MISGFFNENRYLSNYYYAPFVYEGVLFQTVEHAFHYFKVDEEKDLPADDINSWRYKILNAFTPGAAKKLGRMCPMRADWDSIKVAEVKKMVREKFEQNPDLMKKLLATGSEYLEETNTWNDKFWGVCNGVGQNNLGKILMEIRDERVK